MPKDRTRCYVGIGSRRPSTGCGVQVPGRELVTLGPVRLVCHVQSSLSLGLDIRASVASGLQFSVCCQVRSDQLFDLP